MKMVCVPEELPPVLNVGIQKCKEVSLLIGLSFPIQTGSPGSCHGDWLTWFLAMKTGSPFLDFEG